MSTDKNCDPVNPPEVEELFHWNTEPEDRTSTKEQICKNSANWAGNSVKLVEFFVTAISDYFSDPNNIIDDDVRKLIISKDVFVASMATSNTNMSGRLPRIVIEFCGKQAQQNFAFKNQTGYNIHNSSEDFYSHWQIGLTAHVIGNTLNETLLIAEEVNNFLHYFQWMICKAANLLRCQVAEMSKPQYLEDNNGQKAYLCDLSFTAVVANHWKVIEKAPRLKRVTFKPAVEE